MKVAIITLTHDPNYGNILQNIALSRYLQKFGIETETIINVDGSTLFRNHLTFKQAVRIIMNKDNAKLIEKRRKKFLNCCRQNINYSQYHFENGNINNDIVKNYDYFIVGSDQVWNPYFGFATDFEFLSFARREQRISYAASFGVSNIDDFDIVQKEKIAKYLSGFKIISVREDAGINIVKQLYDVPCEVHVDPTMLIKSEEWREMYYKPNLNLPLRYVLVYLLGNISEDYKQIITKIADLYSSEIINLADIKYHVTDPFEFIWIIDHAQFICTDSFHGTVFSILFHKPFYVFNRIDNHKNQNSRFETILRMFELTNRFYSPKDTLKLTVDYKNIEQVLKNERRRSERYLLGCLRLQKKPY